jgi:hypothetical protein
MTGHRNFDELAAVVRLYPKRAARVDEIKRRIIEEVETDIMAIGDIERRFIIDRWNGKNWERVGERREPF